MKIEGQKVVSIHYKVSSDGVELDSSEGKDPLTYMHGAGGIIPGLERALEGKEPGEEMQVEIPPDEAYGPVNDELIQSVPKTAFDGVEKVEPGMQFQATTQTGQAQNITVVKVEGEEVTIDANHPLAGQTLNFDVKVEEVREPTDEEMQQVQDG
ncbi:MAG: peptidylprolyl isomerase [Gammaproteobacteria bacterium]|nr:peptidylprolyl isomerase [Gammaproteobacteria bacterium]